MRGLNSTEVVALWESGRELAPSRRALSLLAPVCPDETRPSLARLTLGERDARLLELRERTFGTKLSALARCPGCGEAVEVDFTLNDLHVPSPGRGAPSSEVHSHGVTARVRLPDSLDLEAAAAAPDDAQARLALLERCVIDPRAADGRVLTAGELPAEFVTAAAAAIVAADPRSEVELSLNCPACQRAWAVPFDIADYFWEELQSCARRLLREVHELAAAYAWREEDILDLTPTRRAAYLELVRG